MYANLLGDDRKTGLFGAHISLHSTWVMRLAPPLVQCDGRRLLVVGRHCSKGRASEAGAYSMQRVFERISVRGSSECAT